MVYLFAFTQIRRREPFRFARDLLQARVGPHSLCLNLPTRTIAHGQFDLGQLCAELGRRATWQAPRTLRRQFARAATIV